MSRPGLDAAKVNDPTSSSQALRKWMQPAKLSDYESASVALDTIARLGIPSDLELVLWELLSKRLPESLDPDDNLRRLTRFLGRVRSPQAMVVLFQRDPTALKRLLEAFDIGCSTAETLIDDPEAFELIRITDGRPAPPQALVDELQTEVASARDERQVARSLQRFHRRETARIAFGLFVRDVSVETTFAQLTALGDAVLITAYDFALKQATEKLGRPRQADGRAARGCVVAFDRFGAGQLGFDNTIQCMFVAETNGRTENARIVPNTEFYERIAREFVELLTADPTAPPIYRLHFTKPTPFKTVQTVVDAGQAFQHYDLCGRTWERQTFVQARTMTGNGSLGQSFLSSLQPWIYRRYLGDPDIAGLGANQRKLHRKLVAENAHRSSAADDLHAAEDIEQMVLFLQLLHGHQYPAIRVANTFQALDRLAEQHLIRTSERDILRENYDRFRRAEAKRIVRAADQVHHAGAVERRELAEAFEVTRRVVATRLDESFPENDSIADETDLILDPNPLPDWSNGLLAGFGFAKPTQAYRYLMEMAEEEIAVLSTRKCRYFLSRIAPELLRSIQATPDPDETLQNLARMSASLGGKGVLWELLAGSPATMKLIVRMCACSDYLVDLLTQSPGMIDELMDSLILDRLPHREELEVILAELCRHTEDIDRVLSSFKHSMHLRVGVRDVLGKDSIVDTHRALSDIAEVCIRRILRDEYHELAERFGKPTANDGTIVSHVVLGLGKLGGQEPNYHSDFSVVIVFESDGMTAHAKGSHRTETTTSRHFFEMLAQRLMKRCNRVGQAGKLFELDVRFGPLGSSGVLAMQLPPFVEYFQSGKGTTLERLSLCKARAVSGNPAFAEQVMQSLAAIIRDAGFTDDDAAGLADFRKGLRRNASIHNIKRGEGGTLDVETLVESLQLRHAARYPEILVPGTLEALRLLEKNGLLDKSDFTALHDGYLFLREIEAGLRLMNMTMRHDLPESTIELNCLALLLGAESGEKLRDRVQSVRAVNHTLFERFSKR